MPFKQIPIAATIDDGPHDRFPVYLQPSVINGWQALTQAEADSSRVYQDADKVVEWPREVVSSDGIHYRHDGLDTGQSAYVDYDGVRADYAVTDPNGRNAVWANNFGAVYHMADANITDSTGNGNNGTNHGTSDQPGLMGRARGFESNNSDYIDLGRSSSLEPASFTIKTLFKAESNPGFNRLYDSGCNADVYAGYSAVGNSNSGGIQAYIGTGGSAASAFYSGQDGFDVGNWEIWHHVYSLSTNLTLFTGGAQRAINSVASIKYSGSPGLILGCRNPRSPNQYFDGLISEFTVATTSRGSGWIATEYANQHDPATFFGTATDVGGTFVLSVEDSVLRQDATQSVVTVACGVAEGLIQDDALGSTTAVAASIADTGNLADSESALVRASAALIEGVKAGEQWAVQADAQAAISAHTALSSQFVISAVQAGNISTADQRSVHDSVAVLLDTFMHIGSDRAITDKASVAAVLRMYRADGRTVSDQISNALRISVSVADNIRRQSVVTLPNLHAEYSYVTIGAFSVIAAVSADIDIKPEN